MGVGWLGSGSGVSDSSARLLEVLRLHVYNHFRVTCEGLLGRNVDELANENDPHGANGLQLCFGLRMERV